MKSKTLRVVAATLVIYVGVAALFLVMASSRRGGESGQALFGPRVAIVELEGVIAEVDDLVREVKAHRENPQVKAVVASLSSVAASGGYYTAVAADRIYANPGTLTGSIGVIMQMANVENLFKKVGVDYVVVKAGHFKDLGNFSRPMTPEERRVLQTL